MKRILTLLLLTCVVHADTIDHYMNIAGNIPQMEVKADPQSQAWARSARNIIALTTESIYESLSLANETATQQGKPLFCIPPGVNLNGTTLNDIIQQAYKESLQMDKDRLTVSQVALMGLAERYPCKQALGPAVAHMSYEAAKQ